MRLVWLDAALTDLAAIRDYIARDDPVAAIEAVEGQAVQSGVRA
jgi:plasmid stabilization system protein ParE